MEPAAEGGSSDAEIPGDLSPGDLGGFHVPEDKESFTNGVSWALALLVEMPLQDRYLHFELIDPVVEKEDFLGLGILGHGSQSFQASPADSSREPSRQQGGSDEERNGGIEDVKVLGHDASFDASAGDPSQIEGHL